MLYTYYGTVAKSSFAIFMLESGHSLALCTYQYTVVHLHNFYVMGEQTGVWCQMGYHLMGAPPPFRLQLPCLGFPEIPRATLVCHASTTSIDRRTSPSPGTQTPTPQSIHTWYNPMSTLYHISMVKKVLPG